MCRAGSEATGAAEGLKRGGEWAWLLSTLGHGAGCTAFVRDHYRVYGRYETPTLSVDRLLGDSLATSKVPCDCLKVSLDCVSTELQASHGSLGVLNEWPSCRSMDSVGVS